MGLWAGTLLEKLLADQVFGGWVKGSNLYAEKLLVDGEGSGVSRINSKLWRFFWILCA